MGESVTICVPIQVMAIGIAPLSVIQILNVMVLKLIEHATIQHHHLNMHLIVIWMMLLLHAINKHVPVSHQYILAPHQFHRPSILSVFLNSLSLSLSRSVSFCIG
jgi:hypothetical protein